MYNVMGGAGYNNIDRICGHKKVNNFYFIWGKPFPKKGCKIDHYKEEYILNNN